MGAAETPVSSLPLPKEAGFGTGQAETCVICMPASMSRNSGADTHLSAVAMMKAIGFGRARDESSRFCRFLLPAPFPVDF